MTSHKWVRIFLGFRFTAAISFWSTVRFGFIVDFMNGIELAIHLYSAVIWFEILREY